MGQIKRYTALLRCLLVLAVILFSAPAIALEPLFFKPAQEYTEASKIADHISLPVSAFTLAFADLNGDGKDEIFARTTECPEQFCWFHVLAYAGSDLRTLALISARSVLPSDSYTSGVRDLNVYASPENDFAHENYVWVPQLSRYTEKSGEE